MVYIREYRPGLSVSLIIKTRHQSNGCCFSFVLLRRIVLKDTFFWFLCFTREWSLVVTQHPKYPTPVMAQRQCRGTWYSSCRFFTLFTCYLNCKYHPLGLINDMQKSIYSRKNWNALFHSLHFIPHEGDWRPTHPPQGVSRVPDYLFMYSIQSVLGLSQVRLTPHTLFIIM